MITNEGKLHIKRYLANYVPYIAKSMSFGIGNRVESLADTSLHLEVANAPISLTSFDFVNNKLVYRAEVPAEYVGQIHEIGLYSLEADPAAGEFSSRIISTFDSASEDWVNAVGLTPAVFNSSSTRVGYDSMSMTTPASTTLTYMLSNIALDLSGYSDADTFVFAFNVTNAFTSAVRFRFFTDNSNYYELYIGPQTAGYKIVELTKGSAVVVGTPSWSNITQMRVVMSSGPGGTSSVELEAARIEDKDAANLDYTLVARKVLQTPINKIAGQSQDIEFALDVLL